MAEFVAFNRLTSKVYPLEIRGQPTIVAKLNQQLLLSLNNNCWYSISKYAN
jgi:hypothetical protein